MVDVLFGKLGQVEAEKPSRKGELSVLEDGARLVVEAHPTGATLITQASWFPEVPLASLYLVTTAVGAAHLSIWPTQ